MSIKITIPNSSSDVLTFGSGNTPTAAQIAGIDSGSSNGQLALYTTASGTSTERVRVDASGNVGIGTASPVLKLDVSGKVKFTGVEIAASEDYTTNLYYSGGWKYRATGYGTTIGASSGAITFNNTASSGTADAAATVSERMRIDSSGNLLVGTTSQLYGERLNVTRGGAGNNAATFYFDTSDDRAAIIVRHAGASGATSRKQLSFLDSGGTERGSISSTGSATAYTTSSDYRLKENVEPMTGALSVVAALKPCTYTWKADGSDGQGFIAHELQAVVPDCVSGEKDAVDADGNPVYQGIDTSFLVATLTAAIQELNARLTALENK